jgi:hypothetical protein
VAMISQDVWTAITGTALGVAGVAWVFTTTLRDKSYQFVKKQNEEMAMELRLLTDKISEMKALLRDCEDLKLENNDLREQLVLLSKRVRSNGDPKSYG